MKTFAVLGLGKYGAAIACQLFNMGYEVLAVDKDMNKVNAISDFVTQAVGADIKDETTMNSLGISNCDCVIVATGDLSTSVLAVLYLKEMGIKKIICKAIDKNHEKVLNKIGADMIVIPEYEMGIKTAISLVSGNVIDYIELSEEYSIIDRAVPSSWINKTIAQLNVRSKYGINIIAIKNNENLDEVIIAPGADYKFNSTDIVVFVGKNEIMNKL